MQVDSNSESSTESLESFSDLGVEGVEDSKPESFNPANDDWSEPVKTSAPKEATPKVKAVDNVKNLETQEDEEAVTEVKEEVKAEGEEKKSEKEVEAKPELAPLNPKDQIKGKIGDEEVSFDKNMSVKVKVDGKNTEVTVQELMNNYAGKQSYDQKFQQLSQEKKQAETIAKNAENSLNTARFHAGKINDIIKDQNANPLDAFNYFCKVQGLPQVEMKQKLYASMAEELTNLMDMDEHQIENYWLKQELEEKNQKTTELTQAQEKEANFNKHVAKIDGLRLQYNVDEGMFMDALSDLTSDGLDEKELFKTPEKIVEYAVKKPLAIFADKVVGEFSKNIDEDIIGELEDKIIDLMYSDKSVTEEDVRNYLKKEYGVSKEIRSLNGKSYLNGNKPDSEKLKYKYKPDVDEDTESWGDFNDI